MATQTFARTLAAAALACVVLGSAAQPLPTARPEEVGLSAERLQRIGGWIKGEVAAKRIPGAVVMVVRNGKVAYLEALGEQDPSSPKPMARDSIVRIDSMTKPLVSVATMMYVEEGKLLLEAPVSREQFAEHLAKLPLHYQPGSTWDYSYSTDVLGRVLEVVAGKPLFAVLKERLLDPLGMKDTTFYVTEPDMVYAAVER